MTSLTCEHCGYTAKQKSNLTRHQKEAVYCLEKQSKVKECFDCTYCEKIFPTKFNLDRHIKTCKVIKFDLQRINQEQHDRIIKLEVELKCSNEQVQDLKHQLAKKEENQQHVALAAISKPTTQVKNTIKNCVVQNLPPLLESDMRDQAKFLTVDHVKAGAQGYAKFALEYPLKDKFTCTDVSRKKLAWKDCDGNLIYDNEGAKLSEKFFRILKERNLKLFREVINDLGNRYDTALTNEEHDEAEAITELTNKICTWRTQAIGTGNGDDTELKGEFVKYLCIANKSNSV